MGVGLEAINVVMRRDTVEKKFPGGLQALIEAVPNATFCNDEYLAKVSFMTPQDVGNWLEFLAGYGFVYQDQHGNCVDICVWDTRTGPEGNCIWLDFGEIRVEGEDFVFPVLRLKGDDSLSFTTPEGYLERVKDLEYIPDGITPETHDIVSEENGIMTVREKSTGRIFYIPGSGETDRQG